MKEKLKIACKSLIDAGVDLLRAGNIAKGEELINDADKIMSEKKFSEGEKKQAAESLSDALLEVGTELANQGNSKGARDCFGAAVALKLFANQP